MPCLLLLLVLAFPRVVLVCLFLFTNWITTAYNGILLPILGFFFLPLTTVVYAWEVHAHTGQEGIYLIFLILAVIIDLGGWGGGEYHRRNR